VESFQPGATPSVAAVPALSDQTIPVSGKRKVIAQRLAESKFQAPHYYLKVSFEMDGMMAARARLNARRKEGKISFNAFIHKIAAEAIKRHPMINAGWEGEVIRMFGSIDIGLAVAVPDGLMTPVVRNCGSKGIVQIDQELNELIAKARDGKLTPEEYTGATFTISNLGSFGIEEFTAIINPPGSAILALGRTQKMPIVSDEDELEIRQVMRGSLSCDHRVIDGALGSAFLADLKEMIENPFSALY
jgi:pyruvate dehydrogenase E2 component (dihydrolipoamide acetyltransferase)